MQVISDSAWGPNSVVHFTTLAPLFARRILPFPLCRTVASFCMPQTLSDLYNISQRNDGNRRLHSDTDGEHDVKHWSPLYRFVVLGWFAQQRLSQGRVGASYHP